MSEPLYLGIPVVGHVLLPGQVAQHGHRLRQRKVSILNIERGVSLLRKYKSFINKDGDSVVDPDPYVFGPPGSASGSVSHM